jgi:hypothetical protein
MRHLIAIGILGVAPLLFAQAHMTSAPSGGSFHGSGGPTFSPGFTGLPAQVGPGVRSRQSFRHGNRFGRGFRQPVFFGGGFWGDEGVVVEQQPPVVVQTGPQPERNPIFEDRKPAPPLIIELQGDRFVRLSGGEANAPQAVSTTSARLRRPAVNTKVTSNPEQQLQGPELPPAVLVFRDGKRQEVTNYTIIGPALYESASYWTSGYWTKKILLADLDLPATVKTNQDRGVNFILPSAPNQIITRP